MICDDAIPYTIMGEIINWGTGMVSVDHPTAHFLSSPLSLSLLTFLLIPSYILFCSSLPPFTLFSLLLLLQNPL